MKVKKRTTSLLGVERVGLTTGSSSLPWSALGPLLVVAGGGGGGVVEGSKQAGSRLDSLNPKACCS